MIIIICIPLQRKNEIKRMEIRHLKSFVSVAETGNMTNAAMRCSVTQGAISHHIKSIETELGVKLFERKAKELKLTEAGSTFLNRARAILKEEQESKEEIASLKGHLCGELRIGVGSFIEPYIRQAALVFLKRYPDVLLRVNFDTSTVLNRMLRDRELDMAFTMNTAYHNEGIQSKPCIPFTLSAIMSKRHRLATKDKVTFGDLMKSRIVMPDCGERVFQTFQHYLPDNDLSKLPVASIVTNASAALMVLDEMDFITFLPPVYTNTSQKLIAKPIETLEMELKSNAHWLKDVPLKASAKAFLEIILEQNKR